MKKALLKDSLKEIRNTRKRFISILLMAFLGVGFFAGIRAVSPDMLDTIDLYFKDKNVYDIRVLSTLGLTDDDIKALEQVEDVEAVYGEYSQDVLITFEDSEVVSKIMSIDTVNEVRLLEGRMPENTNECLVEKSFCTFKGKNIGDTLTIQTDDDSIITEKEITIVGTVNSPLYVTSSRDSSKLGAGKIEYNIFMPKESFDSEVYTEIYITLANSKNMKTNSDEYNEYVQTVTDRIEEIKEEREQARYNEIIDEARKEYAQKIADAEAELIDARDEISKIEMAKWYVLDRKSNTGYNSFIQDVQSMENLGKVFPIVFFVIATLISLTSMTRMVEEQRVQIGTLKALGYNKLQIASKYLIYSSLACIVGGIIGMLVGFKLLPEIVWMMYSMMYTMPDIAISFNWYYAILGLGLAFICIVGASLVTAIGSLRSTPAELMRPKAPKPGKRILLEKIPFIWNRFNFSQKVTIRNIFRYKKRVLMTIIGIAGSTALILTGFGIKDSISTMMPNQFENVYNYDIQVNLKSDLHDEEVERFVSYLEENEAVENEVETYSTTGTLINGGNEESVQVIVPKDEKVDTVIKFADAKTKEKVELQKDKIAITDKLAQLLDVEKGDTITLRDTDNIEVELEVSDIVENYVYHYVYMPKELYEEIYGKYETNLIYVRTNLDNEAQEGLSKEILERSEANSVTQISSVVGMIDDMMSCLNYVVVILIVSAGLLAFVVLYNLANVNISERIRELATIKVLGFYDKEVYDYVTRETVILTIVGILLGLLGGYCLNYFILGTCEINILRFTKTVHFISYVYATLLTVIFTIIVNIATYFALKKIDMIESLKSIE